MKLILKNGFVVRDNVTEADILVEDGVIKDIGLGLSAETATVIDCKGKYVLPGLIDMHTHMREPGQEYKEDLESGAKAAIAGGVTTLCSMANTIPVVDNAAIVSHIRRRSAEIGGADILPFASVTKGMKGEELTEMGDLLRAGACGFSDDGLPVRNAEVMRRALEYSRYFGSFVSCHEEDAHLTNGGSIHEGRVSAEYGFRGIPAASESVMVARDVELARLTGGHLHICHLSSRDSLRIIEQAKNDGVKLTCEVTHNHLTFTDELCLGFDTVSKVNPPLRTDFDRLALIAGVKSGVIDCLISDHAPHHIDDKFREYDCAAFGMTGLQTIIPAMVKLIDDGFLSWVDFARVACAGPANTLGLTDKGQLAKGYRADITVIDPTVTYIFDEKVNLSKSVNTPFWGKILKGRAVYVLKEGKQV